MLRGWDLPIQANISVSFNTKLIPFNLVIAAVCPPQSYLDLHPPPIPTCDPRFQSPTSPACRHPPEPTDQPPPQADKSKISFLLGRKLAQKGMVIYFQIFKSELIFITLFIMIPFFILLGLWLGGHLGGCGC
jgi:hypothetical protein